MKISYNPSGNTITENDTKNNDIIFDLNAKNIWAKGVKMGDADTVDGLHANSFVRKWYGAYGSANKFLSFDTSKEKGWIKLEVADSDNGISGAYGVYIISWNYVGEGTATPTIKCIYTTTEDFIAALTAVRTSGNKFDLYFKFISAAAKSTYTMYASETVTDLNYTVTAVTDIPTSNAYTSSLTSLQLNASVCSGNSATATKLSTKCKINNTEFDGSSDITTSTWGASRTLTIGKKEQSVNGSKDVSWTLSDIGAAASDHTHNYLVTDKATQDTVNQSYGNFRTLYAPGEHGITGVPTGTEAFGMIQMRVADGWSGQILYANGGGLYIRSAANDKINKDLPWKQILDSSNFKNYFSAGSNISLTDDNGKYKIAATNTWRTVNVNNNSINSNPLNLCSGTYVTVKNDNGKVTFDVNSNKVDNWDSAYNWYKNITESDADATINKWGEIVNFLAGIDNTDTSKTLKTMLDSKLSVYTIAEKEDVSSLTNTGIYYSTTDAISSNLANSPFSNGFALLNVNSYSSGTDIRRSRLALNPYGEIKISDDRTTSGTGETWYNVLTANNSGINTDSNTITINNTSLAVATSTHNHDSAYVRAGVYNKGSNVDLNTLEAYSFIESVQVNKNAPGNDGWYNVIQLVHRNGDSDGSSYIGQIALGMSTNTNDMFFRGKRTNDWQKVLTNINSSVNGRKITINGDSTTWENTWRTIKINNASIDQNELNLLPGTNVTFSRTNGNVTINSPNTWRSIYVNNTSTSLGSNSMIIADGTNTTAALSNGNTVKINLNSTLTGITNISGGSGDYWRINFTGYKSDAGALEIATADNGNEPIYVRQYEYESGDNPWGTIKRTLTLLDGNGNTTLPGTLTTTQVKTSGGVIHTGLYNTGYNNSSETDTSKKATAALAYANKFILLGGGETLEMNIVTKNKTINKTITSLTISDSWSKINTISGKDTLTSNGTYIIQAIMDNVYYSGVMSWFTGTPSANNTDEIVLHRGGGGYANTIYLRTEEVQNDKMYLEISANSELKGKTVNFYFQQIC